MTVDEIRQVLHNAASVQMPRFNPGMEPRDRVELLEDYLNQTAVVRAELDRARLHAYTAMAALTEQWDAIEGWQIKIRSSSKPTQAEVTEAKRLCQPDLYRGISDAKWLINRLGEQIHRLEIDDKAASRLYTLIVGT